MNQFSLVLVNCIWNQFVFYTIQTTIDSLDLYLLVQIKFQAVLQIPLVSLSTVAESSNILRRIQGYVAF